LASSVVLITRWGVYHWKDFRFPDKSKNKFWIALVCKIVDPKSNSNITIPSLLPTSRWDKYENNRKRLIDTVVLEPYESKFFKKKTVVDIKNIFFVREQEVFEAVQKNKLVYIGTLEENIVKKIEKTIRNAETLSRKDIKMLLCESTVPE